MGEERLGTAFKRRLVHAAAGIRHRQPHQTCGGLSRVRVRRNPKAAALRHSVAGIEAEIQQRQFQLIGIDPDVRNLRLEMQLDADRRSERSLQHFQHAVHQLAHIDGLWPQFLAPRKREQAFGQGGAALRAFPGGLQIALRPRIIELSAGQIVQAAHDAHQQIVEVVRQTAGQLTQAFHLLHFMHLGQRRLALVRALLDPLLQQGVHLGQRRRAFLHAALQIEVQLFQLPRLAI